MFSKNQTNIQRVLICGNVTSSTITDGDQIEVGSGVLNPGEVVILSQSGEIQTTTGVSAHQKIKFFSKTSSPIPILSDIIDTKRVRRISTGPYTAPTEAQVVVGYDPATSAGAIDVLNLNTYYLRIYDQAASRLGFAQQDITQGHAVSDSTATQAEIALELVSILTNNMARKADNKLLIEAVGDLSTATAGGVVGAVTFTNGSNVVTLEATASVGDYIADGNEVVYQLTSVVGTTGFLDRAYTGTTNTFGVALTTTGFRVTTSTVPFGIRITGLPNSFVLGKEHYRKTRFKVVAKDFGSTPVVVKSAASEGNGVQAQVEELELWASGHNFNYYRKDFMYTQPSLLSTSLAATGQGNTWSSVNLEYDEATTGGIGPDSVSPKVLTICFQLNPGLGSGSLTGTKSGLVLVTALNTAGLFPNAQFDTANGTSIVVGTDV